MEYFAFQFHITDQCDQRCEHCYIFAEDNNICLKEMELEDVEKVITNCVDMCTRMERLPYFYITGGDPILHQNFWDIAKLLKERNIPFGILGNPFHLNDETCARLAQHGCKKYQLSIDGMEKTHDFIRKPGSFATTLAKIPVLKKAGIDVAIMTTVSGTNIDEMEDIVDLVVEHEADIFAFARYCPTSFEKETHIEPLEYRNLLDRLWQKFETYQDGPTTFNLKDHLWNLYLYEKGLYQIHEGLEQDKIHDGCNCANCHMTILPDGAVYACRRMESNIGNVLSQSIYDLYHGKEMEAYRQYDKFEKCAKCELLNFCRGCPAVAYGYTHDMYAPDPQCWKEID
ncbi:MAG: radical SAM/SPASM domain protein, ACGX system [Erysipelotrichaceae bacterium]|nr:radical SAM/SPASM domain protein, ACGX system [Erysipelotrichaceae bacterium]MDD3809313.1 radical SAM/SPASM domain protein, ACGX system [Erysipelotrichaceae bacterium]